MLLELVGVLIGYLLGSIPTAYIVAKFRKGVDIRKVDTGNVGAASVFRVVGRWEGFVVAVIDIGKGATTILIGRTLGISEVWVLGAGLAAILGHSFPVYIGFRGGQGIATIMGIFFVLAPLAMSTVLGIMAITLFLTRHVFATICLALLFLPLFVWLFGGSVVLICYSLAIIVFIGFRNRRVLKKLLTTIVKKCKEKE